MNLSAFLVDEWNGCFLLPLEFQTCMVEERSGCQVLLGWSPVSDRKNSSAGALTHADSSQLSLN